MPDPWSDDWSETKKSSDKPLSGAILSSVSRSHRPSDMQTPLPGFRTQFTLKTRDKSLKQTQPVKRAPPPPLVQDNKETYEEKQRRYQEVREKLLGKD
ncbi:hypothetical protein CJU90_2901 [Yarrowia sp. C11]|nr:hypothetical protein CKK34_4348 [Yarrowia sp. E02]KAG5369448.1 hypothetical protein CJU90_2901 [Yarrowia sp. C11]